MTKFLSLVSLFLLLSGQAFGQNNTKGDERGNGGDYIAQDFAIYGQKGFDYLKENHNSFPFIDLDKLQNIIDNAKIVLLPKGENFPGVVRTASNFPEKNEIKINTDRWEKIKEHDRKMALSLHEYLGLANYEVNNYIITAKLFGIREEEMELPPTIEELKESFRPYENIYKAELEIAKNLKIKLTGLRGVTLHESECISLMKYVLKTKLLYDFMSLCSNGNGQVHKSSELIVSSGVTQLGTVYSQILKIYLNWQDRKRDEVLELYLNNQGEIIQKMLSVKGENNGDREEFFAINILGTNGNIYSFNVEDNLDAQNSVNKVLQANVINSDGKSAKGLTWGKLIYSNSSSEYYSFSNSHFKNWSDLHIEFLAHNHGSSRNWDYTSYYGGVVYCYEYLGRCSKSPDNYKSLYISFDDSGRTEYQGQYIVNGREYSIREDKE